MVDITKNFTTDLPDSEGRYLVGDNHVLFITYYNAKGEQWVRDYSNENAVQNPIINADFSGPTVSGTGRGSSGPGWYELGVDSTVDDTDRYFKVFKLPFYWEEELFAAYATVHENSTVLAGNVNSVVGDYFINADSFTSPPKNLFPSNYLQGMSLDTSHATSSGTLTGPIAYLTYDFGDNPQEVAGFYIDSFTRQGLSGSSAATSRVGEYIIEVATSGTGLLSSPDFTVLASGVVQETDPFWLDVEPTVAKYVRLRYRNNGHSSRTTLMKFWSFSQETIGKGFSFAVLNVHGHPVGFSGRTLTFNQDVDLSNVSRLYFDVKDYVTSASSFGKILVGGVEQTHLSYTGQNRIGGGLDDFVLVRGMSLDVSQVFSTTLTLSVAAPQFSFGENPRFYSLGGVSVVPSWYGEEPSPKRGSQKGFPDESLLVVDPRGLSIVDVTQFPGVNEIDPKLWMRFDLSERKMLQQTPRDVSATEGRVYLATSRGLFVLDFTDNVCCRFDERGPLRRYGIDLRNENHFDLGSFTGDSSVPHRNNYTYLRFSDSPVIPELDLYSVASAVDGSFGRFAAIGSYSGLLIYNDEIDSNAVFYQSRNRLPVKNVEISDGVIWYTQGEGTSARLCRIDNVNNVLSNDFEPDFINHQQANISDTLSGTLDSSFWRVVNQDPNMAIQEGDFLTISGSHIRGGATGFISKVFYADRDFSAKVEVRIRDFPDDARGGLRFGFSTDYTDAGHRSLHNTFGSSVRNGFFLSALNVDPVGGDVYDTAPFTSPTWENHRRWFYTRTDRPTGGVNDISYILPTNQGVYLRALARDSFDGFDNLVPVLTTKPMLLRNFTATLDVQLFSGFSPSSSSLNNSPGAWLGMGQRGSMFPGIGASGDLVNVAMQVAGQTTFSGVSFYTVGRYDSLANHHNTVIDHQLVVPVGSTEGTGATSPFRQWKIDYVHSESTLYAYIDDQFINSIKIDQFLQPPVMGLSFGIFHRGPGPSPDPRDMYCKNLEINLTPLNDDSRKKYGLEFVQVIGDVGSGGIHNNLTTYTTYSGISLGSDSTPSNTVLGLNASLADGNLHTGGVTVVTETSVGAALPSADVVEALYLYDTIPSSDGWNSTATKEIEIWQSEDNQAWVLYKKYDLNVIERTSGITKIPFEPAVSAKYIKMRAVSSPSSNYNVGGGSSWIVSEVQPMTLSGVDFLAGDGTSSAGFREWRLDYTAATKEIKGYIDGALVSTAQLPNRMDEGQFVLVHDLTPVTSGNSVFCADFRNLEVTMSGSALPSGDPTSLYVHSNSTGPDSTNHTVLAASTNSFHITDIELGSGATLPDMTQVFTDDDLFGFSRRINAVFADAAAQRDDGLVFVGTGGIQPSRYSKRYNKPFWIEKSKDPTAGDEVNFGGSLSFGYHPGLQRSFIQLGRNVGYFCLVDFENEEWVPVSRADQVEAYGLTSDNYNNGPAKFAYSHYDDLVWVLSTPSRLFTFDLHSGDHSNKVSAESIFTDPAHFFLVYVMHDHTLCYGVDFINRWDVVADGDLIHPRNYASDGERWNRTKDQVLWNAGTGFQGGTAEAVYCAYDKNVYFVGSQISSISSPTYFYKYDPDKDYLEEIATGLIEDSTWPISDEELEGTTPFTSIFSQAIWLVYDPFLLRIYIIGARDTVPQFYYYDVVEQKLVYPGETPTYASIRDWPDGTTASEMGVSHAVYDISRRSVLMYGRAGKTNQTILEFIPERNDFDKGFEYIPSRDGLPTASGITKHFTRNKQPFQSNYGTDSVSFNRDFYKTRTNTSSQEDGLVSYRFEEDYLVISGSVSNATSNHDRSMWIISDSVDGTSSFDFSAMISMPTWSSNIGHDGSGGASFTEAFFSLVIQDGLNPAYVTAVESDLGRQDPDIYQMVEVRAGVSGTLNSLATSFPFTGHIVYKDGQGTETSPGVGGGQTLITTTYDTYLVGGLTLPPGGFGDFREFRLSYDYDTDLAEAFIGGTSVGSVTLKRKFTSNVRFGLQYYTTSENGLTNNTFWEARIKDLKFTPKAWEQVSGGRLVTSISGSVGSYIHERWDPTLVSGTDWVYSTNAYLPTSKGFAGNSYICSLAGIGDGNKLVELSAIVGPASKKQVGLTGALDERNDQTTFFGVTDRIWDDLEKGEYLIVRDTSDNTVKVYFDNDSSPSISVDYSDLPDYKYQHIYYGKVDYGSFESIYTPSTLSGTWTAQPDFTGSGDPVPGKRRYRNDSAYAQFATLDQFSPVATATYSLAAGLGEVDVYVFYVASGFDLAKNAPFTIFSSGTVSLPPTGTDTVVSSINVGIDHLGGVDSSAVTVRVDQRKTFDNRTTSPEKSLLEGSGWVFLGKYVDPATVILTTDAEVATTSNQGFVCAGAIGINPGKRGQSTADLSVSKVHYLVGSTSFNPSPLEESGISVIDLSNQELTDFYGAGTVPSIPGGSVTSGDKLED